MSLVFIIYLFDFTYKRYHKVSFFFSLTHFTWCNALEVQPFCHKCQDFIFMPEYSISPPRPHTHQIIMVTECRSGQNRHQTKWSGCLSFLQKIRCSRFSKLTIMYGPTKIMSLPLFLIPTDNFL